MITKKPDLESSATKIWQDTEHSDDPFSLARWIIWAPWVHSMWPYHFCSVVHLRDVEGSTPAKMQFPEATHEFMVLSLNPEHEPDPNHMEALYFLTPPSIAQQFTATDDAEALEIIELNLQLVLQQRLSLDSDYRRSWEHILREHTIDEMRQGVKV